MGSCRRVRLQSRRPPAGVGWRWCILLATDTHRVHNQGHNDHVNLRNAKSGAMERCVHASVSTGMCTDVNYAVLCLQAAAAARAWIGIKAAEHALQQQDTALSINGPGHTPHSHGGHARARARGAFKGTRHYVGAPLPNRCGIAQRCSRACPDLVHSRVAAAPISPHCCCRY